MEAFPLGSEVGLPGESFTPRACLAMASLLSRVKKLIL